MLRRKAMPSIDVTSSDGAAAWQDLVVGNLGEVWSAVRAAGLSAEDAAEVSELTWLGLATELDRIVSNGTDVRAWLLTAVDREARIARTRAIVAANPGQAY